MTKPNKYKIAKNGKIMSGGDNSYLAVQTSVYHLQKKYPDAKFKIVKEMKPK